jgi:hypothetical protein
MSTIINTIAYVVVLWFHVGVGPMIGTGPMDPRPKMRRGAGRLGSAEKRPKPSGYKPLSPLPITERANVAGG